MKYANAIPYPLLKVTLINVYECGISRSFKMQKFRNTIGGGRRPPDFGSPDSKKNAFCYARSRLLKTWMGAPIPLCCEACLKGMQHHWLDLGPILEPKATKIVLPLLQRFGQANRFGIPIKISILFTSLCRQFMTFFLLYTQEVSPLKTAKKCHSFLARKFKLHFSLTKKIGGSMVPTNCCWHF